MPAQSVFGRVRRVMAAESPQLQPLPTVAHRTHSWPPILLGVVVSLLLVSGSMAAVSLATQAQTATTELQASETAVPRINVLKPVRLNDGTSVINIDLDTQAVPAETRVSAFKVMFKVKRSDQAVLSAVATSNYLYPAEKVVWDQAPFKIVAGVNLFTVTQATIVPAAQPDTYQVTIAGQLATLWTEQVATRLQTGVTLAQLVVDPSWGEANVEIAQTRSTVANE